MRRPRLPGTLLWREGFGPKWSFPAMPLPRPASCVARWMSGVLPRSLRCFQLNRCGYGFRGWLIWMMGWWYFSAPLRLPGQGICLPRDGPSDGSFRRRRKRRCIVGERFFCGFDPARLPRIVSAMESDGPAMGSGAPKNCSQKKSNYENIDCCIIARRSLPHGSPGNGCRVPVRRLLLRGLHLHAELRLLVRHRASVCLPA